MTHAMVQKSGRQHIEFTAVKGHARGLSFGSRGQKGVIARLGMRGKIQNNNHQWHATAQGVSHAAAKHRARFRGLRVLLALSCAHQPNIAFQRTPTHPIASATPCGRL